MKIRRCRPIKCRDQREQWDPCVELTKWMTKSRLPSLAVGCLLVFSSALFFAFLSFLYFFILFAYFCSNNQTAVEWRFQTGTLDELQGHMCQAWLFTVRHTAGGSLCRSCSFWCHLVTIMFTNSLTASNLARGLLLFQGILLIQFSEVTSPSGMKASRLVDDAIAVV